MWAVDAVGDRWSRCWLTSRTVTHGRKPVPTASRKTPAQRPTTDVSPPGPPPRLTHASVQQLRCVRNVTVRPCLRGQRGHCLRLQRLSIGHSAGRRTGVTEHSVTATGPSALGRCSVRVRHSKPTATPDSPLHEPGDGALAGETTRYSIPASGTPTSAHRQGRHTNVDCRGRSH